LNFDNFTLMQIPEERLPELIHHLSGFVSENRLRRFNEVLAHRTAHLRIVLENIYQGHNAAAVLRSCDCFGLQHVHVIEQSNSFRVNEEIAMGSGSWLSIHRHSGESAETGSAIKQLKILGYRVIGTVPDRNATDIARLDVKRPLALLFGTEGEGLSSQALGEVDECVTIPMSGFTESFNLSVSAAICMYELTKKIRSEVQDHSLPEGEKKELLFEWLSKSIPNSGAILSRFLTSEEGHR
jgi:tRNA (guanosine-2'-O-)-methyltransferase